MTLAHRYPNIPAEEFTLHNVTLLGILIFSTLAVTQPYSDGGMNVSVSFSSLGTFGTSLSSDQTPERSNMVDYFRCCGNSASGGRIIGEQLFTLEQIEKQRSQTKARSRHCLQYLPLITYF